MINIVLRSFSSLLGLFLLPLLAFSQGFHPQFLRYTTADGLPSNTVYTFEQDDFGYIWMGSSQGLCRFDGTSFTQFKEIPGIDNTIKGEKIIALFKDRAGNIWAGTNDNGLNFINAKTAAIRNFQHQAKDTNSLISNEVTCIFEDYKGRIWVGAHGLNLLDQSTGRFTRVVPFQDQAALKQFNDWQLEFLKCVQDPDDVAIVWLTAAYGVCRFNVETFDAQYFFIPGSQREPSAFRSSFLDENGMLWLTDWWRGLHRFDTKQGTFELFKCTENGIKETCLNAADICPFDNNQLLFACPENGLLFFDKRTGKFSQPQDLPNQKELPVNPRSLFKDRDGNLWISTTNSGLYCLQPQRQIFKKTALKGDIKQALQHPKADKVFACSGDGQFFVYDIKTRRTETYSYPFPPVPNEPGLLDLAFDQSQKLWVLGHHDIYQWGETKHALKALAWPAWRKGLSAFNYFWDFGFDEHNNIWVSAQNIGLCQINIGQQTFQTYRYEAGNPNSLLHDYSVGAVLVDKNNKIWGANRNGFFYYDPETERFFNSPSPPAVSDGGRAFSGSRSIAQDSFGNIWITAMLNRIGIVCPGAAIDAPVQMVETSVPLPLTTVHAMIADQHGNIWIGSDVGLTKINASTYATAHYGAAYGLSVVNNLSRTNEGEILASVPGGFYRFHPDSIAPIAKAPVPVISEFKVFDKAYGAGFTPAYLENVQLSYQQNFFSFEFSALDFTNKQPKEFAYQLEGLEPEWVLAGDRRYAAYTNISGGDYTFKVRVRNESGSWSAPAALHIRIIPPIWERWWFWLLVILALAAIIYGIYRYRVNQIRKVEALKTAFNKQLAEMEMKALRAQMNPHFLFNSLNAIKFYVLKRSKEKAAEYLTDFSRLIRLVLHNSSQQLITLKEELEALELYVRIELLRFDEQFDFEIKTMPEVDVENFLIPPMLLQPYVENAIWHGLMHKKSGKGKLLIALEQQNGTLQCTIEDNGIGREKAKEVRSKSAQRNKSMGMSITRHRMDISQLLGNMHFDVQVEDLMDASGNALGTRVIIRMHTT